MRKYITCISHNNPLSEITRYCSFMIKSRILIKELDLSILFSTSAENDLLSLLKNMNFMIMKLNK